MVSAENRKHVENIIRDNFDAKLEEEKWQDDYDIIITTEVLAEGINLHRSNLIVNYDVPWNSTRLMQRIGRVNRIGSTAEEVFVYNFYPTAKVNDDIELEKKAIMKLFGATNGNLQLKFNTLQWFMKHVLEKKITLTKILTKS